jgi:hypothetical protein
LSAWDNVDEGELSCQGRVIAYSFGQQIEYVCVVVQQFVKASKD